jgi:hypothetical protein
MKCHVKGGGLPVACFFLIFGFIMEGGLQVVTLKVKATRYTYYVLHSYIIEFGITY